MTPKRPFRLKRVKYFNERQAFEMVLRYVRRRVAWYREEPAYPQYNEVCALRDAREHLAKLRALSPGR